MEKKLTLQLKDLKSIRPQNEWKLSARDVLYSQISNTRIEVVKKFDIFKFFQNALKFASQPVVVIIFLFIFLGGFFGIEAAQNTKPGDSLYIARVLSEKAHLAITFNEEKKQDLSIRFSSNNAKDITRVLADPNFDQNEDKKNKLSNDFRKEISAVKSQLVVIDSKKNPVIVKEPREVKKENDFVLPEGEAGDLQNENQESEEEARIFSADFVRDEQGMQVADNNVQNNPAEIQSEEIKEETEPEVFVEAENDLIAKVEEESDSTIKQAHKKLEEAEVLFNENDYNGALAKIEEADSLLVLDKEEIKEEEKSEKEDLIKEEEILIQEIDQSNASGTENKM